MVDSSGPASHWLETLMKRREKLTWDIPLSSQPVPDRRAYLEWKKLVKVVARKRELGLIRPYEEERRPKPNIVVSVERRQRFGHIPGLWEPTWRLMEPEMPLHPHKKRD